MDCSAAVGEGQKERQALAVSHWQRPGQIRAEFQARGCGDGYTRPARRDRPEPSLVHRVYLVWPRAGYARPTRAVYALGRDLTATR